MLLGLLTHDGVQDVALALGGEHDGERALPALAGLGKNRGFGCTYLRLRIRLRVALGLVVDVFVRNRARLRGRVVLRDHVVSSEARDGALGRLEVLARRLG